MSPRKPGRRRKSRGEDPAERLRAAGEELAEAGKKINRDPRLLAIVRSLRRVLPGDAQAAGPGPLSGSGQPRAVGRMLSELGSERPGVLGEAGLGALQVWQTISEAQGRGRGKTEMAIAFTDLVNFSDWALEAGDEAAVELLRDVSVAIEPPVSDHRGTVVKRLGDGMMAVFRSADEALAAIVEGRRRLAEVKADGYTPAMRAGIHVGRPRKVGKDYFGVDVNIAARVADGAEGGELLLSDAAVATLPPGTVTTSQRELRDAKGVPAGFMVHSVTPKGG